MMCGIVEHHVTKFVSRRRQYDSDSLFVIKRFPLRLFVCLFVYCILRGISLFIVLRGMHLSLVKVM